MSFAKRAVQGGKDQESPHLISMFSICQKILKADAVSIQEANVPSAIALEDFREEKMRLVAPAFWKVRELTLLG